MPFVQLSDARVAYESAGSSGSGVLLVMGFGAPGRMWQLQADALAQHHRVAWFDNVGAGSSTWSGRRPLSMRDLGRHATGVLDALGWRDAHVVGVSMGGMVAQELALNWRDRVRSLTLIATHAGGLRNLLPPPRSLLRFGRGFLGPRAQRAAVLERLIFPEEYLRTLDVGPLRSALGEHVATGAPALHRALQLTAVVRHRTADRLRALASTPTLVVKASQDQLIRPSELDRLHRLIPGSRLVEFEDAGHAILYQCATRLNQVLLDHFAGVEDRRSPRVIGA